MRVLSKLEVAVVLIANFGPRGKVFRLASVDGVANLPALPLRSGRSDSDIHAPLLSGHSFSCSRAQERSPNRIRRRPPRSHLLIPYVPTSGNLQVHAQLPFFFRYYAKDTSHGISENRPFGCEHKTRSLRWCPSKIAPTTSDDYLDSPTGEPRISVWPLSTTRFVYVAHDSPGWLITLLEVYLFVCVGVRPR